MAVFGITDSTYVRMPPGQDADYLMRSRLADGTTFAELIPLVNRPVARYNGSVPAPIAELMAPHTTNVEIQGRGTDAFEVNRNAEYDVERPQKPGKGFAHYLAIWGNTVAMEWTEDGLRQMTAEQVVEQVEMALNGMRNQDLKDFYGRVFDPSEVPVDDPNQTALTSPGFAGSGTGPNAFGLKLDPKLRPLPDPYSHYWACTVANISTTLLAMALQHRRWFAEGDLVFKGSKALVADIVALGEAGGFVRAERAKIRESTTNTVAQVNPELYVGVFNDEVLIRRPTDDWVDKAGYMFVPQGNLSPNNPIVPRYSPLWGQGAYVRSKGSYPLEKAIIIKREGWNVKNRVGMELLAVNAGATYQAPDGLSALGN